jgi:putative intracellular protease/amidase
MATVLLPLPARDFDPTEVSVSWRVLVSRGHNVVFATPEGQPAAADDLMVTGRGLDPWGMVPLVRDVPLVGRVLRAKGGWTARLRRTPP